jgi:hypothetical protein
MSQSLEEIERILGQKLNPDDKESVTNLNKISSELVRKTRQLTMLLRLAFLHYYVDQSLHQYLPNFIEEVIEGDINPTMWRLGRILVPSYSVKELFEHDVASIIQSLKPTPDEAWKQLKPNRRLWEAQETLTGAPAVVRPNLDYRWRPDKRVIDLLLNDNNEIESVSEVTIATRRWMASNFARAATSRQLLGKNWHPEDLAHSIYPDLLTISEDALIAMKALLAEQKYLGENNQEVPGFRGPDEWFANNITNDI